MNGVTPHMEFIDDRRFPGMAQRLVALPVKVRVSNYALRSRGCIVVLRQGQVLLRRGGIVAKSLEKVTSRNGRNRCRAGIDHQFVGIEAVPFVGSVGPD